MSPNSAHQMLRTYSTCRGLGAKEAPGLRLDLTAYPLGRQVCLSFHTSLANPCLAHEASDPWSTTASPQLGCQAKSWTPPWNSAVCVQSIRASPTPRWGSRCANWLPSRWNKGGSTIPTHKENQIRVCALTELVPLYLLPAMATKAVISSLISHPLH